MTGPMNVLTDGPGWLISAKGVFESKESACGRAALLSRAPPPSSQGEGAASPRGKTSPIEAQVIHAVRASGPGVASRPSSETPRTVGEAAAFSVRKLSQQYSLKAGIELDGLAGYTSSGSAGNVVRGWPRS